MEKFSSLNVIMAAWWTACFAVLLLPLRDFDAHFFMGGFLMLVLGVIACVAVLPARREMSVPRSPFLLMLGGFWLVAAVSVVFSEVPFISFIYFCFLSILPFAFLFAFMQRDRDAFFRYVYVGALGVFAILGVSSLTQYFFFPQTHYNGLVHLPAANPNSLAGILSLGVFAFYGLMIGGRESVYRNLGLIGAALLFAAMLTTGSRGAFLSLFVGLGFFVWLGWKNVRSHGRCHLGLAVLGVVAFVLISYFEPSGPSQTPMRVLSESMSGQMPLLWDRLEIWAATWEIIKGNMWNGTGIGTFFMYYPEFRTEPNSAGFMAHNDPLHFWAEMGVVAPILFYLILIYAVVRTLRVLKVMDDDSLKLRILIPFCALGALVLHTHISFHFYIVPLLFLIGTLLAYWFYETEKVLPSKPLVVTKGRFVENFSVQVMLVVLLVSQGYVFARFQGSEILLRHAKEDIKADKLERFVDKVNRAGPMSFNLNARALAFAATVPSGILRARKTLKEEEKIQLIDKSRGLFEKAIRLNPRLASFYYELSLVSAYAKREFPERYADMDAPMDLMVKAFRVHPQHASTRLRYAMFLEADGRSGEAYHVLKEGLNWNYQAQNPVSYFQKTAVMAVQNQDFETQERALSLAVSFMKRKPQEVRGSGLKDSVLSTLGVE